MSKKLLSWHSVTFCFVLLVFSVFWSASRAQTTTDPKIMNPIEYKAFLSQIEAQLPKWQSTIQSVTLENTQHMPYSQGKLIEDAQIVALNEIDNLRAYIGLERRKRTLDGELMLMMFLNHLFDESQEIMWRGAMNGLPSAPRKHIENYSPEINEFSGMIYADVQEKVSLLEKKSCQ